MKQVILVRTDIEMPLGKIASQVAHASLGAAFGKWHSRDEYICVTWSQELETWLEGSFTKIVLACPTLDEMLAIEQKAKDAKLQCKLIVDNGDTVFNGVPTVTCLGIGPDTKDKLDPITGHLRLL